MSITYLVGLAKQFFEGLVSVYYFLFSLPELFVSWFIGMPQFFQIGIAVVCASMILVLLLKLKTYLLF